MRYPIIIEPGTDTTALGVVTLPLDSVSHNRAHELA
jgi:hypothetical protein